MNLFTRGLGVLAKRFQVLPQTMGSLSRQIRISGASYDYKAAAGDGYDNSIVSSAINYISSKVCESVIRVQKVQSDGTWIDDTSVAAQNVLRLIHNPNAYYSERELISGAILSGIVHGTGYWIKVRGNSGRPEQLIYASHTCLLPKRDRWQDGREAGPLDYITRYEWRMGGSSAYIDPSDVVLLRYGAPDPSNPSLSISPLDAALREIATDNEAATYTASILRNMGIVPLIFSAKDGAMPPSKDQRDDFKAAWSSFTGENRGIPAVIPIPVVPHEIGTTPEKMALDKIRSVPAERICSVLGLDPMVLGLSSSNKTYANRKEAREGAVEEVDVPLCRSYSMQLSKQLLPDFGMTYPASRIWLDTSGFKELQDDQDALYDRANQSFRSGWLSLNEARLLVGKEPIPNGDLFAWQLGIEPAKSESTAAKAKMAAELLSRLGEGHDH